MTSISKGMIIFLFGLNFLTCRLNYGLRIFPSRSGILSVLLWKWTCIMNIPVLCMSKILVNLEMCEGMAEEILIKWGSKVYR